MSTSETTIQNPLWLEMEIRILEFTGNSFSEDKKEEAVQLIAKAMDEAGFNVSNHGDNLLDLRWALDERIANARPLMTDFNAALAGLELEDVADPYKATVKIISDIGDRWPKMQLSERKGTILDCVEKTKLDLLIAKAKELGGDKAVRFLIEEGLAKETIAQSLEIADEKYDEVKKIIDTEQAEKSRVLSLLEEKEGSSSEDTVKHLIDNKVSDALILELAGIDQSVVDGVKKDMEAELEARRKLEEEAAKKREEAAAGPPLEEISPEERLEHIEAIRDIMDLCDKEEEIRSMCSQSNIPKCLVDIAIANPDDLDAIEKEAEG